MSIQQKTIYVNPLNGEAPPNIGPRGSIKAMRQAMDAYLKRKNLTQKRRRRPLDSAI